MGRKLLIMILMGALCVSACGHNKQVEKAAKQQSLAKLEKLRQQSVENYRQADLNTHIVEQRERNKARMRALRVQIEAQADEKFAVHKQNLEDEYQLKLFNLRMQLENLRMRPQERAALEEEITAVRSEREMKLQVLQQQRQAYVAEQLRLNL